jgi:sec-independent protein translocase protein TatB
MFDIGWAELFVVAILLLLVVGPKDLPKVFKTLGRWMAQLRRMSKGITDSWNKMSQDIELDELEKRAYERAVKLGEKELDET